MSTLIVLLPPRDPAVPSQEWQLPELPFLLLDKSGRTQRAGRSSLGLLPRASSTVLMVAARDLLLMSAALPPLKGQRLRQALPNVVEDQLIQDPQTCHIALDPEPPEGGRQRLAVIDRGWFRYLCEAFAEAGHRNLRAVPVTRCLPDAPAAAAPTGTGNDADADAGETALAATAADAATAQPVVAAVLGVVVSTAPGLVDDALTLAPSVRVELALARGLHGEGMAVPVASVHATLAALAGAASVTLYLLTDGPGSEPVLGAQGHSGLAAQIGGAQPLTFDALARRALACRFDLCQFEFAVQPWRIDRATLRRLRVPIAFAAAALVIAVIGTNVQWLMLSRQRDAINAQMTETLLNTFPKTTVVLDAPGQMSRQMQQLRVAAGELSPDDFLSLAAAFARALGPVPVNGIAALDYHDHRLDVTFKPEVKVDSALAQRLARNGLSGTIDSSTGKWTIRSGQ